MQFVISTEWLEEVKYPLHHKDQATTYYCALLDIEVVVSKYKRIKDYPYLLIRIALQLNEYGKHEIWKYEAIGLHKRKVQVELFASDILILNQQTMHTDVYVTFTHLRKVNKYRLNRGTTLEANECT